MIRVAVWCLFLLAGCQGSIGYGRLCGTPDLVRTPYPDEPELLKKAEYLCRHQMLDVPVVSRLPPDENPLAFIREEDLDFVSREPSLGRHALIDETPGLASALGHLSECKAWLFLIHRDWAEIRVGYTRPEWDEALLRAPEVRAPKTPGHRLGTLSRWLRHHPATQRNLTTLRFVRTPEGWRVSYQLPEKAAWRPRPPVEVRLCLATPDDPSFLSLDPEVTRPRLNSGPRTVWYTEEAREVRAKGAFIARCLLTREGVLRDCCVRRSLSYMDETVLDHLRDMRFSPMTHRGQPIEAMYDLRCFGQVQPYPSRWAPGCFFDLP